VADNVPFVVNDGESTPVAHTFSPLGVDRRNGRNLYANFDQTYAIGRETVEFGLTTSQKVRTVPVTMKVPRVVVETINGVAVPKVADYGLFKGECIVPLTWTDQEAKNLHVLASGVLNSTPVAAAIESGENPW
jgi:hypothetical protein